ncbi:hypothetical protein Tco_0932947 [Tanacetum coccineum]
MKGEANVIQNRRDLPRDIPLDSVAVLRYEKRSKSGNKGKVPTEMELALEQTQQGTSYEVSVSAEGVEELKRKVKIKGEKKEALLTLRQKPEHQSDTQVITMKMEILLEPTSNKLLVDPHGFEDGGEVITEYLVNISKRRAFWSLNEDILKITILTTNTPYPSRKIRRIRACTHQRPQRKQVQYAVSRKGNTPYSSYMGITYSERYQTWSLLQETPIRRIQYIGYAVLTPTPDPINTKLKNEF